MRSRILTVSAALVMLLSAGCGGSPTAKAPGSGASGNLSTVNAEKMGEAIRAARGRVVVVNVWATWCPPCVAEMPEFARFYTETDRAEVVFLSVNANAPDTVTGEVKPFIEKHQLPFPVLVLADANPDAIGKAVGAEISGALPLTLVYDRAGKLQKHWEEAVSLDGLTAVVKPLL